MLSILLTLLSINIDTAQLIHKCPSQIRDYYLCSSEEMNCQSIIRFLVAHAEKSVVMVEGPVENEIVRKSIYDANQKGIIIEALISSRENIDFFVGNDISLWIDKHNKMKRFIIIDGRIIVTGAFSFTGKDGSNAEAIEVDWSSAVSYIYQNEMNKHKSHSTKVEIDFQ